MADTPGALLLALVLGATACQKPPPEAPPPAPRPTAQSAAERYMPLEDGTVYAYDTESPTTGEHGLLVLEVRRPRPEVAELVVAGRTSRLEIDATGLRHATGGWLLKDPLSQGAEWQGDFGNVRVTAVNKELSVPAGTFAGCVETVEELTREDINKKTTTVYCPDVGMVTRVIEGEGEEGYASVSLKLKSFGPRVSL